MELKSATCPNCGGNLELDPSNERGICPFCKCEILVADAIQKFKGVVEGIATNKSKLTRATQMLQNNDYDGAIKTFRALLDTDPENHEAWWGLFNCDVAVAEYYLNKDGVSESSVNKYKSDLREAIEQRGKWAVDYAPADKKSEYESGLNNVRNKIETTVAPKKGFCYIATAVYGSYDASEVLTLRRYRDEVLSTFLFGRLFIDSYYYVSPPLAKFLKNANRTNIFVRSILDKMVRKLNARFENDASS
ncbi:MAG: tetratricopeptide repeat protein [Oscillospiraceae bacterium]|nr:tetratricopeptide repeat protein [Oscillospiraceae bacterium]